MRFYSTKDKSNIVGLREAVLRSLPKDGGLYMPMEIPSLGKEFFASTPEMELPEMAINIASPFLKEDFSDAEISEVIDAAVNFPAPVKLIHQGVHSLELWHGPSLAFKDFGARFMAAIMSRLVKDDDRKLTILVATSGDTGGAVASGFLGVENVEVIILYPSGKVSPLQEKQLTTLGQNIKAIEIQGTFDDCQTLVKQAFLDEELNKKYKLSSANSINISRLIPQSFYYLGAYAQLGAPNNLVFSVPSGNFGNMTAGLLAKGMGLPVQKFIAATNANDIFPNYLRTGEYEPKKSRVTISNAMDVGNPSNFQRIQDLYKGKLEKMREDIDSHSYSDELTRMTIQSVHDEHGYVLDPHGAVAYKALSDYMGSNECTGVILETAHPAKFLPVMEPILGDIEIPEELAILSNRKKSADLLSTDWELFKSYLIDRPD